MTVMDDLISKRSDTNFKRFDKVIYEVARKREIDAIPLLDALESSRSIASGVVSLLLVLRSQDSGEMDSEESDALFNPVQIDDLLSLCITSLDLLNSKIEAVADLMSTRYGLQ